MSIFYARRPSDLLAICFGAALLLGTSADAATTHFVRAFAESSAVEDTAEAADGAEIDRDLLAENVKVASTARSQMDRFGNVAMEGVMFSSSTTQTQAEARSSEFVNPFGLDARVTSNVIIDGGLFRLLGPVGATLAFQLQVFSTLDGGPVAGVALSTLRIESIADFGDATAEVFGLPLDFDFRPASSAGLNEVTINPSLLEIDLGVARPGERFEISYSALITGESPSIPEIIAWEYRDPMSIALSAPTFTPIDPAAAVPLPPTAILLAGAIASLITLRSNGRGANGRRLGLTRKRWAYA